eukprot:9390645-Heterocapsa_arctica.AAC.1
MSMSFCDSHSQQSLNLISQISPSSCGLPRADIALVRLLFANSSCLKLLINMPSWSPCPFAQPDSLDLMWP